MTFKPFLSKSPISNLSISKLTGLTLILCVTTLGLAGCDKASDNPKLRTFHPSSTEWQQEIEASYEQLTDEERQLLDRFIERFNADEAVKKGASETISIEEAIQRQQKFEASHPENQTLATDDASHSTDASTVDNQMSNRKAYPLTLRLLPTSDNENTDVKKTPLDIEFNNEGKQTLLSFKGTVHLNAPNLETPKAVVIPLKRFDPPLNSQDTTVIQVDTSVTNEHVLKALQNPENISITINKGTLKVKDGEAIEFEPDNAK